MNDHADDPDLDALLGAYALDALEPDERARVEAYLERNTRARDEVDELRETAATLALAPVSDVAVPPELWDRIAATIASETPDIPETREIPDDLAARRARRNDRLSRWTAAVAAAAAVVTVVFGAQVLSLHRQLHDAKNPSGREVALAAPDGRVVAHVVVAADGRGRLVNDHLDALPADHTYQLWALMGDAHNPTFVSAGVLGPNPKRADFDAAGPLVGLALTVEQAGGVVKSAQQPVATASVA